MAAMKAVTNVDLRLCLSVNVCFWTYGIVFIKIINREVIKVAFLTVLYSCTDLLLEFFVNALSLVKLIVYRNYDLPGTSICRIIPPHAIQLSPYCALYFNETIKKLPKQNTIKSNNLTNR